MRRNQGDHSVATEPKLVHPAGQPISASTNSGFKVRRTSQVSSPAIVATNLPMEPDRIIRFYNQRGTAEQHVEAGRQAINRTRLSCKGMARNEVRLQLHASACNPGVFLQGADLSAALCSPASLRPSNGSVRPRYRPALPA